MVRLADHERRAHAHDALGLAQDPFDAAGIAVVTRDLARALGGLGVVEPHDASLDLRDRLLCDDDDVVLLELDAFDDQRGEVVSGPQLGNPRDGEDAEAAVAAHGRPVIRTPACAR